MSKQQKWSRRKLLQAGLAAPTLSWLSADRLLATENDQARRPRDRSLFLFTDWFQVKKGELQVVLDPERITSDGKKLLETYARDFQKTFEQGSHGFKPADTPSGIRIVQEVAERTQPWLVSDQPWEKSVTSPTVLYDEGRYRCWYSAGLTGATQKTTVDQGQVMEISGSALAYAESQDGPTWTKPSLKIHAFYGSSANNLVSPFHNCGSVFRDDHGLAEERYRNFYQEVRQQERYRLGTLEGSPFGRN